MKKKNKLMSVQKAVKRVLTLCAAYLMEEDGWDVDRICEFYDGIVRWSNYIDSHLISLTTVNKIIEEHTGAKLK